MMNAIELETLEEIIRNCQRNEQRLQELKRHTRHERQQAERLLRERRQKSIEQTPPQSTNSHRVRFNLPSPLHPQDDELADLSRRCEDLLLQLHTPDNENTILDNHDSITLQRSLELLRPEFLTHSRQRVQRINHLRAEREDHQSFPSSHSQSFIYQEMKRTTKKKYQQLPEVNERLQQDLTNEIKRRNSLRAKIFRLRLRQHVLLHGRTNIDQSMTMLDP